jgi:hypothetical protein
LLVGPQAKKLRASEGIAIARPLHGRISHDKVAGLQTRTRNGQVERSQTNNCPSHVMYRRLHCEHIAVPYGLQQYWLAFVRVLFSDIKYLPGRF